MFAPAHMLKCSRQPNSSWSHHRIIAGRAKSQEPSAYVYYIPAIASSPFGLRFLSGVCSRRRVTSSHGRKPARRIRCRRGGRRRRRGLWLQYLLQGTSWEIPAANAYLFFCSGITSVSALPYISAGETPDDDDPARVRRGSPWTSASVPVRAGSYSCGRGPPPFPPIPTIPSTEEPTERRVENTNANEDEDEDENGKDSEQL
ncbi:hypothetical protein B0H12DRAFT_442582 [Mycena haematopus]|nr:hypothetical protein B0H12DRAFT_442582 [Mycena haematopus]